ncbi:dehydrodolichyl diphosphate synthase complex subunit DHDDS-like, partial [Aphis craccivora]
MIPEEDKAHQTVLAAQKSDVLCLTHPDKSWIRDESMTWNHRFCAQVLTYGEIPKHVAFIMNGDRSYAKKNCISTQESFAK